MLIAGDGWKDILRGGNGHDVAWVDKNLDANRTGIEQTIVYKP